MSANRILFIDSGAFNTFNSTYPGEVTVDEIGASRYSGQIGAKIELRGDDVPQDTTVGTLYGGVYQLVKTKAGSTIQPAKGLLAFWDPTSSPNDFVVTPDIPTSSSLLAGVYLSAPTKGNYCIIQVKGLATVQCVDAIDTTGAVGQRGYVATGAKVDNDADATDLTDAIERTVVGTFFEAPANAGLKRIFLTGTKELF